MSTIGITDCPDKLLNYIKMCHTLSEIGVQDVI